MQALLSIFRDIHIYGSTLTGKQLGVVFFFFENQKEMLWFWKKAPWLCLYLGFCALKTSGCAPAFRHYSFRKTLHLKSLRMFWIRVCLGNCSAIGTTTLWYVLHQTHSEFWHIQNSIYSGIFRHIQGYLKLLRHIHVHWGTVKTYSGLFRHIQHTL